MLHVYMPNTFEAERSYILDVLLGRFLGLSYRLVPGDYGDYRFVLSNGRELVVQDHFFGRFRDGDDYLQASSIPERVAFGQHELCPEPDIPVLFGTGQIEELPGRIIWGNDIFAAAFFMLTRWEETVVPARDRHLRFPAEASLAYKRGFLHRPIVNEYVEMLWRLLLHLGFEQKRKPRHFQCLITHDVDDLIFYRSPAYLLRNVAGDILKRREVKAAVSKIGGYWSFRTNRAADPYDTYDWLMDLSERINVKSRFYFMSGGLTKYDNRYDVNGRTCQSILRRIKERGHIIGFHPSYGAYNDPIQWKREKTCLEEAAACDVREGRQHYLRFEAPFTWEIWDDNGMDYDSTLCYAEKEGFRCGTCYAFPVFHVRKRKRLALCEIPLLVMEATLAGYQAAAPEAMTGKIGRLIETVKKYDGEFVLLWHNSCFNLGSWIPYKKVYEEVIESIG